MFSVFLKMTANYQCFQIKDFAAFYLEHHDYIVPRSSTLINPYWLDLSWRQQDPGGVLLNMHGHTGEQVGCRAEQGEMDLHSHRLSAQPATWMQDHQFGCSIRPAGEQRTAERWWRYCREGASPTGNYFSRGHVCLFTLCVFVCFSLCVAQANCSTWPCVAVQGTKCPRTGMRMSGCLATRQQKTKTFGFKCQTRDLKIKSRIKR